MNSEVTFASLGLAEPILRAIGEAGYTHPTPIQAQAIPQVMAGGDLLAAAQTGTGKTAGFTLPILHRLASDPKRAAPGRPRCLILTPTRELAAQVEESVKTYGRHLALTSMVMFGGVGMGPQISGLRKPLDILVATPGRLLDHIGQKNLSLSDVEILVLDEADRMLDMGFIRDIKKVLALLPKKRQNLLFSATFSDEIKALADGLLDRPGFVEVARRNTASELVTQSVYMIGQKQKRHLLAHLIKKHQWFQVLVFTRTKHGANRLAEQLDKEGIPALAIHGNKSQGARTRALSEFKSGDLQVLVATDIAARGLDIDQLPQVVNFELPNVPEDYVHRIGRTGRAGSTGAAISLVDDEELKLLAPIERLIRSKIDRVSDAEFVPGPVTSESHSRPAHPAPAHTRGGRNSGARGAAGRGASGNASPHQHPARAPQPGPRHGRPAAVTGQAPKRNGSPQEQGARAGHGNASRDAQAPRPQGEQRRRTQAPRPATNPQASRAEPAPRRDSTPQAQPQSGTQRVLGAMAALLGGKRKD
ncbi:DEAD/DEAH box helicase [Niveibacterium sp. 24ML]|uniref:DEAD/DEAH box helicase n=1 Tax=Niveibacterium sp. 24ML TaxID=2985512 RepID=UPI00226D5D7B|nr:DEAD/DEAH box helicase [Niveibacterium sp. 24ML]MCX9155196.1 DEAD/DEAH box helicase [Niveibacterium sp. 24ML]